MSHPIFAIVGHPNKGKSSVVATLAEDDSVAIAPDPGTTRQARGFAMRCDGRVLYELVDTPGFQRPRAALAWLQANERGASERAAVVAAFVEEHRGGTRFHDECELLRPVLAGAGILYVVDGALPYGSEYEAEMEILRWTGQPRMALINPIGHHDHVDEWRRALNQYFSIVRVFDAVHADFGKRIELLRAFRELGDGIPGWSAALNEAIGVLEHDHATRRQRSAEAIAALLVDALSMTETAPVTDGSNEEALAATLLARLRARITRREAEARRAVQSLYRHESLDLVPAEFMLIEEDIFSARSFALFGLSQRQLLMAGAATGAAAGSVLDVAVGGTSLLFGAGVGALVGGVGAALGSQRLATVRVLGSPLGGDTLQVGPVSSPNLPWVLLGRALLHHQMVAERNHARREAATLDLESDGHLAGHVDPGLRRRLAQAFKRVRAQEGLDADARNALEADIDSALAAVATRAHPPSDNG
ncbi:MAG: DUF3482 domain-containing protein [Gammaproteobacteria bacterium]